MSKLLLSKSEEKSEFTVTELTNAIKRTIDDNFGFITVRGEVSGLKVASSGHAYFNLKDGDNILACTCWRPVFMRMNFKLEDGLEVLVSGRLSTYGGMSRYQLSAEKIEPAGAGALMELLNRRRILLAKEGLFDDSRKKSIPFFAKKIGVITSPVGSVIQDIIHRVKERCPVTIMLWPVAVQGENCATEVASAIEGFNNLPEHQRPDIIIIARGGGSAEDLWGFNEEVVVRAAAASDIPIISAIGHETDTTLLDFVSDKRAPTPTAAAEFATQVKSELEARIKELDYRAFNNLKNIINHLENKLEHGKSKISLTQRLLFAKMQKLDELSFKLLNSLPSNLKLKESRLSSVALPINAIYKLLEKKSTELHNLHQKSEFLTKSIYEKISGRYLMSTKLIETMSINQILKRGFAIVRDSSGEIIKSAETTNIKQIEIQWSNGKLKAELK
jgi:exodeoxyribonuclease VII large subunit